MVLFTADACKKHKREHQPHILGIMLLSEGKMSLTHTHDAALVQKIRSLVWETSSYAKWLLIDSRQPKHATRRRNKASRRSVTDAVVQPVNRQIATD